MLATNGFSFSGGPSGPNFGKYWYAPVLLLLIVLGCVVMAGGQDKPQASASTSSKEIAVSKEDLEEGTSLAKNADPVIREMQSSYNEMISATDKAARYSAADRHALAVAQLKPFQDAQQNWIKSLRTKYKCPDCELINGKLIPVKTISPEAAQKSAEKGEKNEK